MTSDDTHSRLIGSSPLKSTVRWMMFMKYNKRGRISRVCNDLSGAEIQSGRCAENDLCKLFSINFLMIFNFVIFCSTPHSLSDIGLYPFVNV